MRPSPVVRSKNLARGESGALAGMTADDNRKWYVALTVRFDPLLPSATSLPGATTCRRFTPAKTDHVLSQDAPPASSFSAGVRSAAGTAPAQRPELAKVHLPVPRAAWQQPPRTAVLPGGSPCPPRQNKFHLLSSWPFCMEKNPEDLSTSPVPLRDPCCERQAPGRTNLSTCYSTPTDSQSLIDLLRDDFLAASLRQDASHA